MDEEIKFIQIVKKPSHVLNMDETFIADHEAKYLNLENITRLIPQEEYTNIKLNYLVQMKLLRHKGIGVVEEKDDLMLMDITRRVKRKYIQIYYDGKIIFKFLGSNMWKDNHLLLFNSIFIVNYTKSLYYISNIKENYNIKYRSNSLVRNILLDISKKTKDSTNVIILHEHIDEIHLKRVHFSKCEQSNESHFISKIIIQAGSREYMQLLQFYSFGIYYELSSNMFIILVRERLFLFENVNSLSFLLSSLDISFSKVPYPYVRSEGQLGLLSSENFYYKITINSRCKDNLSIFKDLTLNFNNEKYTEMLEHVKVIMYYNIEIDNVPFNSLSQLMSNIFQDYDIFAYIENISNILNEENIHFFINHNIESAKLHVIIVFCLIYERIDFLKKIFQLLLGLDSLDQDITQARKFSLEFVTFVVFFEDFVYSLIKEFESIDTKCFIDEFNKKIFGREGRVYHFIAFYLQRNYFKNGSESKDNLLDKYVELFTIIN